MCIAARQLERHKPGRGGGYVGSLQVAVLVILQGRNARGGSYGGWRRVGYWLTGGRGGVGGGGEGLTGCHRKAVRQLERHQPEG